MSSTDNRNGSKRRSTMSKAKRVFRNKTVAWMAPFNKDGISMATTKGESLLAGGTGELFACSVRVVIGNADKYRLVPVATGRVVNGKFVERKKAKKKAARRAKADEPRIVLAPDGDWDIRTGTHLYRTGRWYKRQPERDLYGGYFTRSDAEGDIVTARAAWKAMKRGMGKQGERRAAS